MIASACVRFYTKTYRNPCGVQVFEIPCHRHGDALKIISQFVDWQDIDKTQTEQGFLTHDGIFLSRVEALQHAIACQQLPAGVDKVHKELYSEDLW